MAKPKLGTKRICPGCGAKYYDLERNPIVCPTCGVVFVVAASPKAPERAAEPKPVKVAEEVIVEREAEVVSLEEAEAVPEDIGPDVDDEEVVIPDADVEVDEEVEPVGADTFLEEEEEAGADVADLLDVDAEEEEER